MNLETATTIMIALIPILALWTLLDLIRRVQRRREQWVARQIALTDAIHRELGAVAAPVVTQSFSGTWTVAMSLPLQREATVGVVTRLTQDLFRRLDRQDPPRLRLVLIPRAIRPVRPGQMPDATREAGRLSRAA